MASLQTRRGSEALIFRVETVEDAMGNKTVRPHARNPHKVRISQMPDRSAKAELPGQQEINVLQVRCPPGLDEVNLWSRVYWRGKWYDLVAPPGERDGSRNIRHWTLILRKRPDGGGLVG